MVEQAGEQVEASVTNQSQVSKTQGSSPSDTSKLQGPETGNRKHRLLYVISLLALLLAVMLSIVGGYGWWSLNQSQKNLVQYSQLEALNFDLERAQQSSGELNKKFAAAEEQLVASLNDLEAKQQSLQQAQLSLFQVAGKRPRDWVLAEVEYLIRIADHQMQFAGNFTIAAAALKSADSLLADLADPGLIAVRAQLAKDIEQLSTVQPADKTGIILKLSELARRIETLPFKALDERAQKFNQPVKLPAPEDLKQNWSGAWQALWKELKSLVAIQQQELDIAPLMNQDQKILMRENIQLNIEQAKLAVLQENEKLFQESLATVQQRIKSYYDLASGEVNNVLMQIESLQAQPVDVSLPYVGKGISMVREEMADRLLARNLRLERNYKTVGEDEKLGNEVESQ
ncbi:MAG TPA: hypothetical protein DCZ03_08785 [Gammaproteobacteria bacterium]|nr:hypothetical protein [Gammaproteobacteria bacterium]